MLPIIPPDQKEVLMEHKDWVDFRAVKDAVTIEQVLGRYGVKLKRSGKELRGRCPVHNGEGTDTFHANTDKNAFHCFSCNAKGNVLDLVAAIEKCSVRDAALRLKDWFSLPMPAHCNAPSATPAKDAQLATKEIAEDRGQPNKPLNFTLKGIDHAHPYLAERGIDKETAAYFGVGFFSGKGSMAGRIVIPIENERGELVAYAGRSIDGTEPKYKLPAGFKKSQVLFNLCRALEEDSTGPVVLVEGFFDCMKVTQAEHVCVALMGCSLSKEQETQLVAHFRQVVIMLDGDEAGRNAAIEITTRLVPKMWVRIVNVPEGSQPDQVAVEELRALLAAL
jgi:DNA primase